MKYQFCIRFSDVDINSAASKAVLDCNSIFTEQGFRDFTLTVANNANRIAYYPLLLKSLFLFFIKIKSGSVLAVQYPLLSINNLFRYFVVPLRLKKILFFCIVHDLHSLRTGGTDQKMIKKEIANLNRFNAIIVHSPEMLAWLTQNGLRARAVILDVFDYLSDNFSITDSSRPAEKIIVYAGNLIKSKFIYNLGSVRDCTFRLYGPGYSASDATNGERVQWMGEYSPEQIAKELRGNYGLIWDGESCDRCDSILGNYLRFNSPHKFSLYIAAGLPVIAPAGSAIGSFIAANNIGILINSIYDLENLDVNAATYTVMKANVILLRKKIIAGGFFTEALQKPKLCLKLCDEFDPVCF